MKTLSYATLEEMNYDGYLLKEGTERVLQFGEGNFLRGFVDYFIDVANEKLGEDTKVVLAQPIAPGLADMINAQDGLYTLYLRGKENGEKVESSTLSYKMESVYAYRRFGGNDRMKVTRYELAINVKELAPFGYMKLIAKQVASNERRVEKISSSMNTLENEYMFVTINGDGSLVATDKITGEKYDGLNVFVDCGEIGGPLMHIKPFHDERYSTLGRSADIALVMNKPELATYKITHTIRLPKEKVLEYYRQIPSGNQLTEHGNFVRSAEKIDFVIESFVTLKKGSKLIEIDTKVNNNILDHKLSVSFGTGINTDFVQVDEPFDVVDRKIEFVDSTGWLEEKTLTYPTTSFLHKYDGKRAITFMHKGLCEYEMVNDKDQTLMLTLLRCFDVAGGGAETFRLEPLAECQGLQEFSYAISLGSGEYVEEKCYEKVNTYRVPEMAVQCTKHEGTYSESEKSFLEIENKNLVISAVKIGEDNESVVLRFTNMSEEDITSKVKLAFAVKKAEKVTIEEEFIATLDADDITVNVGKKEIYTMRINL